MYIYIDDIDDLSLKGYTHCLPPLGREPAGYWWVCKSLITDRGRCQFAHGMKMTTWRRNFACGRFLKAEPTRRWYCEGLTHQLANHSGPSVLPRPTCQCLTLLPDTSRKPTAVEDGLPMPSTFLNLVPASSILPVFLTLASVCISCLLLPYSLFTTLAFLFRQPLESQLLKPAADSFGGRMRNGKTPHALPLAVGRGRWKKMHAYALICILLIRFVYLWTYFERVFTATGMPWFNSAGFEMSMCQSFKTFKVHDADLSAIVGVS